MTSKKKTNTINSLVDGNLNGFFQDWVASEKRKQPQDHTYAGDDDLIRLKLSSRNEMQPVIVTREIVLLLSVDARASHYKSTQTVDTTSGKKDDERAVNCSEIFNERSPLQNAIEFQQWLSGRLNKRKIHFDKMYLDRRCTGIMGKLGDFCFLRIQTRGEKSSETQADHRMEDATREFIECFNIKYGVNYVENYQENIVFSYDSITYDNDVISQRGSSAKRALFTIQLPIGTMFDGDIVGHVTFQDILDIYRESLREIPSSSSMLSSLSMFPSLDIFAYGKDQRIRDSNVYERGGVDMINIITMMMIGFDCNPTAKVYARVSNTNVDERLTLEKYDGELHITHRNNGLPTPLELAEFDCVYNLNTGSHHHHNSTDTFCFTVMFEPMRTNGKITKTCLVSFEEWDHIDDKWANSRTGGSDVNSIVMISHSWKLTCKHMCMMIREIDN